MEANPNRAPNKSKDRQLQRISITLSWLPADVHSVLDAGCGEGLLTNQLDVRHFRIGIDLNFEALRRVNVPCTVASVHQQPFANQSFDAVISTEVIEHIPAGFYPACLSEIARMARHYVLLSVPYQENLKLGVVTCPRCGHRFHPSGHLRSFNRLSMEKLMEGFGFRLVRLEGLLSERKTWLPDWIKLRIQRYSHRYPQHVPCPSCSYCRDDKQATGTPGVRRRSLRTILESIWPKVNRISWWLALYKKENA